jgi:hypothetical protein
VILPSGLRNGLARFVPNRDITDYLAEVDSLVPGVRQIGTLFMMMEVKA